MKKWFAVSAGVFILYLVLLVINLPASFVASWLTLPKNISVMGIRGTIWQPKVEHVLINDVRIDNVEIDVNVVSLLTLDPTLDISFGDPMLTPIDGEVTVSGLLSAITLSAGKINFPAAMVAKQIPAPIDIVAHQFVSVELQDFVVGKPICQQLAGVVTWQKAAVTVLEQKVALGNLSGRLSCEKGEAKLTLNDNNDLGLNFAVNVAGNGRAYGQGFIKPTTSTPAEIKQVLPMVSKADNQGRFPLRF